MSFLYRNYARSIQKIVLAFFSCTGLVSLQLLAATPSQENTSFHTEPCDCNVYPRRTSIMHLPPILPPLICNGGDGNELAYPVGRRGIEGLSSGDTVARYRRDLNSPLNDSNAAKSSRIARTNCECIYAPRFGSVRNVTRLHEESAPQGPAGVSSDKSLVSQRILQPLGNTAHKNFAIMLNLVGDNGFDGNVFYENLESAFNEANTHVHIYGKEKTRPNRKMGHITIICDKFEDAYNKAVYIKSKIKVKTL